ncbi:transcriptional regulator [Salmonella enterica]|nr:transcriptional regulator [Salmonella enterica]
MDNSNKDNSPELLAIEANKPVGGVRIPKKVSFELDVEKTLKGLILIGIIVIVCIYGYKGISYLVTSIMPGSNNQIAVLDMATLKRSYAKNAPDSVTAEQNGKKFDKYFSNLMELYRVKGYLVIDYSLTYSIPNSVKIVTYIDEDALYEELKSKGSELNKSGESNL